MLFSSVLFLVWFLPIVYAVCFSVPKACRNAVLLAASFLFYGWGRPTWLILISVEILAGYLCGLAMERYEKKRKAILTAGIVFTLVPLFVFKYYNFFASGIEQLSGLHLVISSIVLPAGISFYTFQIISYLADVYRNDAPVQHSLVKFALYVAMFFQLIAGPIVRYSLIDTQLDSRTASLTLAQQGSARFLCGLFKKVLIANPLSALSVGIRSLESPSVVLFWINAIAIMLYVYYDFSGYSDMAIGLGKIAGFTLPENFNYPFVAGSFTNFWRRWHMTLTGWFRDYVYIPLGGNRKGKCRQIFNLLVVWLFTGLWHGAAWNFVLWGLLFFVLISAEKFIIPDRVQKSWLYHAFTLVVLLLSFLLFYDSSLAQFGADIAFMFGFQSVPVWNVQTGYILRSSIVLIAAAAIGATPIAHRLFEWMKSKTIIRWLLPFGALCGLLLCLAMLSAGTYNPFLYFQF